MITFFRIDYPDMAMIDHVFQLGYLKTKVQMKKYIKGLTTV